MSDRLDESGESYNWNIVVVKPCYLAQGIVKLEWLSDNGFGWNGCINRKMTNTYGKPYFECWYNSFNHTHIMTVAMLL